MLYRDDGRKGVVTRTLTEWPLFFVFVRHDGEEAEKEYFMMTSQNPATLRLIPQQENPTTTPEGEDR